jgi:hypothetical protein
VEVESAAIETERIDVKNVVAVESATNERKNKCKVWSSSFSTMEDKSKSVEGMEYKPQEKVKRSAECGGSGIVS